MEIVNILAALFMLVIGVIIGYSFGRNVGFKIGRARYAEDHFVGYYDVGNKKDVYLDPNLPKDYFDDTRVEYIVLECINLSKPINLED